MGIKKIEEEFLSQTDIEQQEIEEFKLKHKDAMLRNPNLIVVKGKENSVAKYYLKNVETVESLIDLMEKGQISKDVVKYNIKKYKFTSEEKYILESLGMKYIKEQEIKVESNIEKQAEIFKVLFDQSKECFVRIRNKATGEYRSYNTETLKNPLKLQRILKSKFFSNRSDLMYTLNAYNHMSFADEKHLFSIQNLALDIDFDTEKYKLKTMLKELKKLWKEGVIPTPNIVEFGHRIRLIYSLEDVAVTQKSIQTAKDVISAINEKLPEKFNSSAQPLTTFGRLNGTINSKGNAIIRVNVERTVKYTLREFQYKFLEKPVWKEKVKKANEKSSTGSKRVYKLRNKYTLNIARLDDLRAIQKIRQEGYRELLCYVYRNYCLLAHMTEKEAWEATKKFNKRFDQPLKENYLDSDTKHLNRKQYVHQSKTLLELFDISRKEEKALGLKTIISENEKRERKAKSEREKYKEKIVNEGKISRAEKNNVIREEIKLLVDEGRSQREIATALSIGIGSVNRHIQAIKVQS